MGTIRVHPALGGSFRDPSGSVFTKRGIVYRRIEPVYQKEYQILMRSGLYKRLTGQKLLIPHRDVSAKFPGSYKTIRPTQIPFVSYPYEWCFGQLQDAALTTLAIERTALAFGTTLKDASAYNIQFLDGKPIFIDTLSFTRYIQGQPWIAYRQFCMHFLAPLLLMAYVHPALGTYTQTALDGISLDLASSLLPPRTWLNPSILFHIHLHARAQSVRNQVIPRHLTLSQQSLLGIIDQLEKLIASLTPKTIRSDWTGYYQKHSYTNAAFRAKEKIVRLWVTKIRPRDIWDIGANTGLFSHIAARRGIRTISIDADPLAVEANYRFCKKYQLSACLPLIADMTSPTPARGWNNEERLSLLARGPAECMLFLGLLHHLVIRNNIPLPYIAKFAATLCRYLIIEFIPKEDAMVQQLLTNRTDIFPDYHRVSFETVFQKYFVIKETVRLPHSTRRLYLMKNKKHL